MAKSLTKTNLKKEAKAFDEYLTVRVTSKISGEEYDVKVDKHFRKSKVTEVIAELMTQVKYAEEKGIDLNSVFTPYSMFLILKHFSSLKDIIPDDLETQISMMRDLSDLKLLEPIFNSLPKQATEEVADIINDTLEKMTNDVYELAKTIAEIQEEMRVYEEWEVVESEEEAKDK